MADDVAYLEHRGLVVRIAYDITGSWTDAEDVAQQTYLRWHGVTTDVEHPRAYLARIATHLALDAVAQREKVGYPGTFLPEPVATGPGSDAALDLAAEVEVALMVVLGTLSPLERAAFLLHDVFAFSHGEVAEMLGRQPAAVRQLAARARNHVEARRPDLAPVDPAELMVLTGRFVSAAQRGDIAALTSYLTADVVFIGDGGGKRSTALRPVQGAAKVARLFIGLVTNITVQTRFVAVEANHRPALAIYVGEELDQVLWLVLRDGRIDQVLAVRNPDKLRAILA